MSNTRQTVSLTEARFYAYHGFYPEEQLWGNEFFVSIHVRFRPDDIDSENLESILNYEELYAIAKKEMNALPQKLLETLVELMVLAVRRRFGYADEVTVFIRKVRPPFGGDEAGASVSLTWKKI